MQATCGTLLQLARPRASQRRVPHGWGILASPGRGRSWHLTSRPDPKDPGHKAPMWSGAVLSNLLAGAGAYHRVRAQTSSYPALCSRDSQVCVRSSTGLPSCLPQHRLGLGCKLGGKTTKAILWGNWCKITAIGKNEWVLIACPSVETMIRLTNLRRERLWQCQWFCRVTVVWIRNRTEPLRSKCGSLSILRIMCKKTCLASPLITPWVKQSVFCPALLL